MSSRIPLLIRSADGGDRAAVEELFSALYRKRCHPAGELARNTLVPGLIPATLLQEAYLVMLARAGPAFPDGSRFVTYAVRVIRGLIVDDVRNRSAHKRCGAPTRACGSSA